MARRKLTVVEQAIKDAAKELNLPKDHWDVERLATMTVMLKVARHKWSQGQSSGAAGDMLTLMSEISAMRSKAGLGGPREIEVSFLRRVVGVFKCCKCGERNEIPDYQRPEPPPAPPALPPFQRPIDEAEANPKPASEPVKPDEAAPVVTYRSGVSVSKFHSAVVNGVAAPLKRDQPSPYPIRKTSPLSE